MPSPTITSFLLLRIVPFLPVAIVCAENVRRKRQIDVRFVLLQSMEWRGFTLAGQTRNVSMTQLHSLLIGIDATVRRRLFSLQILESKENLQAFG